MLEYSREFIILANCLNYTKAAGRLNVSQPSLSRHIADLEKELGFQLLERNPLMLTSAGRYYLESISDVIERLDEVIGQGRTMAQKDKQNFSIFMLPSKGLYSSIIYEGIARMRNTVEGFSPRIYYADRTYSVFDAVVSGKAEVGVVLERPSNIPEGYACEWLVDSPVMIWLHEDSPLLNLSTITFDDLSNCYLVRSTTQSARTWFDGMVALFQEKGIEPKYHLKDLENRESFFLSLRPDEVLLASDEGETICPYNPRLVGVRLNESRISFSTHVLFRTQQTVSPVTQFVEKCHAVAQEYRDTSQ